MRLLMFPLLVVAAPALVMLRGHFGRRIVWTLLLALATPFMLRLVDAIALGLLYRQPRPRSTLSPQVLHFADTLIGADILALPFMAAHILALWMPRSRDTLPRNDGYLGSFTSQPATVAGLLVDWLRIVIAVLLSVVPIITPMLWPEQILHLFRNGAGDTGLILLAAFILVLVARFNRQVLPGFAGQRFTTLPLWRYVTRYGRRSSARHSESLSAIFSRRPRDLRSIAGS